MIRSGNVQQRFVGSRKGRRSLAPRRALAIALASLVLAGLASPATSFAATRPSLSPIHRIGPADGSGDSPLVP
jgi:hypothetical protein